MTNRTVETLIIGAGQAGLAVGYHLTRRNRSILIVDANERIGDAWRNRWDSLSLFTPNRFNGLPGMEYPGPRWGFPTKDEFADYLEEYARKFDLPVERGIEIERLSHDGQRYVAQAGDQQIEADNVVVAMSSFQEPREPDFAAELDAEITQVHVADYKNPGQLRAGSALVVGAGNSGAEIAVELSRTHEVLLSGTSPGVIPFRPESGIARVLMPFVGRIIFHRVLTTSTPIGRKARPKIRAKGSPLLRIKPKDLIAAGVERVARTVGVEQGRPKLEDGRRVGVDNVVWCTGFKTPFTWIDLPIHGPDEPKHKNGIVDSQPGLYFVGLDFLYSKSSEQIHGVGRDAARIANAIDARLTESASARVAV